MTDQFLTVEEALRGWLNGETLQSREKGLTGSVNWHDYVPASKAVCLRIDTQKADYRFKPKQRWAWVIVSKADGFPSTVFPTKPEADGYCARNSWAQAVRMVEQPE